jgi:hypothetical protein
MVPTPDRIDVGWNPATLKAKNTRADVGILLDGADNLIDALPRLPIMKQRSKDYPIHPMPFKFSATAGFGI